MIAVGTKVAFAFTLNRVSLADPIERRSGEGVVVSNEEYSVWPAPGYAIRVVASPDYKPGEVVRATTLDVRMSR